MYSKGDIATSFIDDRKYKHFTLPTGMKCILISDPEAELSSVCILNPKGSLYDPPQYQGLTHFMEHMLFLGSKKYPHERHYREFISNHGGKCNAWTFWNFTYFHFDIDHENYEEALDILSEQLTEPLFDFDAARREIWAVNSEHFVNSSSNVSRYHTLLRDLAHPESAFSKYLLGNLRTLDIVNSKYTDNDLENLNKLMDFDAHDNKRDDALDKDKLHTLLAVLKKHHESTFSADQMFAVLLSNKPLKDIENLAKATVGKIPKRAGQRVVDFSKDPGPVEQFGKMVRFRPISTWEFVSIFFFLPPMSTKLTKPIKFINYLVASSTNLSLASFLKEQGMIFEIFSYYEHANNFFSYLELRITLTKKGHDSHEKVIRVLGAYLFWLKTKFLLKDEDLLTVYKEWVHEKRIVSYYSSGSGQGLDYCTQIAKNMCMFGADNPEVLFTNKAPSFSAKPKNFISIDALNIEEGIQEVGELLKCMDGKRSIGFFCSSEFLYDDPNPKTKFGKIFTQYIHGVKYTVENVAELFATVFGFDWEGAIDYAKYEEAQKALKETPVVEEKMTEKKLQPPVVKSSSKNIPATQQTTNQFNKAAKKGGVAFDVHLTEGEAFGLNSKYSITQKKTRMSWRPV